MKKVCLVNLGCKVNQYETDAILNSLNGSYETTSNLEPADIYVVNTCAVTSEAEKKSRQILAKIKKINDKAKIYVCGCASQNDPQQFLDKNATYVIGTFGKGKLKDNFENRGSEILEFSNDYEDDLLTTNVRTRAYLKIQDGCNNFCSYCIIPFLRGRSRSRKLSSIVGEAQNLSKTCEEIVLTGINISDFKIEGKLALIQVLKALSNLPCRVRLSSLEVTVITPEFLKELKTIKNFCPHFHLSLQSGSDKVLSDMNRHYTTKDFLNRVCLIRTYFENPTITTDLIVGYPTETESDFNKTLLFLKKVSFSNIHFFAYSSRKGTRAGELAQINGKIIKQREDKLKILNKDLNINYLKKFINKPLDVLIEDKKGEHFEGFSQNYIKCFIKEKVKTGEIVQVVATKIFENGLLCEKR